MWWVVSSFVSRSNPRSPLTVSRSPVIDKDTSFSRTPGSSKFKTRSSLVSCMSRTGAHIRTPDAGEAAVGRPRKLSKRRLTSPWMSDMFRNGSHLSTDTNGRQRSIAIVMPSLALSRSPYGPALFEYVTYISYEYIAVKSVGRGWAFSGRIGGISVSLGG